MSAYETLFSLKIGLHCKQELLDKNFLESSNVILFIKQNSNISISIVIFLICESAQNYAFLTNNQIKMSRFYWFLRLF